MALAEHQPTSQSRIEFKDFNRIGDTYNPEALLARVLSRRNVGVTYREEPIKDKTRFVNNSPRVRIDTTEEGEAILGRLQATPEYRVLARASSYHNGAAILEDLGECDWDEEIASRVLALFLTNKAAGFLSDASHVTQPEIKLIAEEESVKCANLAERHLHGQPPLTQGDVLDLFKKLVDRELPPR